MQSLELYTKGPSGVSTTSVGQYKSAFTLEVIPCAYRVTLRFSPPEYSPLKALLQQLSLR